MQMALQFKEVFGHGGRRKGAGRKKAEKHLRKVSHDRRAHKGSLPVLVTVKVVEGVPNLRGPELGPAIGQHIRKQLGRHAGFQVTHFSILSNHLHFLVEADSQQDLSRGMQGLLSGSARVINRLVGRRGKLWADRYHAQDIDNVAQARYSLRYVLCNIAKHGGPVGVDPMSSGVWFDGWVEQPPALVNSPVARPRTWLLAHGWHEKGGGKLSIYDRPA